MNLPFNQTESKQIIEYMLFLRAHYFLSGKYKKEGKTVAKIRLCCGGTLKNFIGKTRWEGLG